MKYKYKLRFYHTSGTNKGNLDHEEFFQTKKEMDARYREAFIKWSPYNPTAWDLKTGNRIEGY